MVAPSAVASRTAQTAPPGVAPLPRRRSRFDRVRRIARAAPHMDIYQIARQAGCHSSIAQQALNSAPPGISRHLRRRPAYDRAHPDQVRGVARDVVAAVRMQAAWSPNCPPAALARLVRSTDVDVRAAVAANANCPPLLLVRLAADPAESVRSMAALNKAGPPGLRACLAARGELGCGECRQCCGRRLAGRGL